MRFHQALPSFTFAVCAGILCSIPSSSIRADEKKIDVASDKAIYAALENLTGQSVTLFLASGSEISGSVNSVGPKAVLIRELAGKELFSAVVEIDSIAAVSFRTK